VRRSKWSNRFIWAAVIQGFFAVLLTIPIVLPSITPSVAMVIANGSAGTWVLVGYVMFITVGVIASGLTALFYYHFEVEMQKAYRGIANALAWVHLVLMNVGAAAATWALMYAGYIGETALMPTSQGGLGLNGGQVHSQILVQWVDPIGALLAVTAAGVLAGGLGFLLTYFRK